MSWPRDALIAAEIIARAKDAGVYVHESPELVALLMPGGPGRPDSPELYVAVAELLAWLYAIEKANPTTDHRQRQRPRQRVVRQPASPPAVEGLLGRNVTAHLVGPATEEIALHLLGQMLAGRASIRLRRFSLISMV